MPDTTRRMLSIGLAASMLPALPACAQTMTDLKTLRIPGVEPFAYRDESTLPLNQATTRLAEDFQARGAARGVDGQTLAADEATTDEAIARAVDAQLGKDWKRSDGFSAVNPAVTLMVWESTAGPRRFYAIAAWNKLHTSTEGRKYRPLEAVFTRT